MMVSMRSTVLTESMERVLSPIQLRLYEYSIPNSARSRHEEE